MKNFYMFLSLLLIGSFGFGQTTIYAEDFTGQNGKGAVGPTPTIDLSGVDWNIDISSATLSASTDWFRVVSERFEARDIDGESIWLSPVITINGYTNVSLSLATTSQGGMEPTDIFISEYRIDGTGGTWTQFSSNGSLNDDFNSATVTQTGLSGNTLEIRVRMNNGAGSEIHSLDDISVEGTLVSSNDTDTEVLDPTSQVTDATVIAANVTTNGTAFDAFGFDIEDQGSGDGLPTNVTTMRFVPGPNNTADWTDAVQGVTLLDGNLVSYTPTTSISDTEIILTFASAIAVPDNTALEFLLGLYLNTSNIIDGSVIQLQVDAASSGFAAEGSGSNFIDPFTLGAVVGNDLTIDVDVTELIFTQQPPATVGVNAVMSDVIVQAQDVNGNVDTDYNLPIDITSTGTLSVSPVTELPIAGITTFTTITHTATGTGLVLTANDGLLPTINSSAFDVADLPVFIAIQDFETVPQTPVFNFSNTNGAISTGSGPVPNDDNFVSGSQGWEANNETSTLTFGPIDVSAYDDIELDLRLAAFGTSTNGLDGSDEVLVQISTDNGVTFSDEIEIEGNGNARWSFDTGEGIATTIYDGDNSQAIFAPSGGNDRTTDGYSFISITDITNSSELVVRIIMNNNSGNEYWIIDDVTLSGILLAVNDSDTEVLDPTSQVADATVIAADVTTSGTAFDAFGFDIEDQGSGDGLPTNVTTMRFVPGPNNTADWTDHIQGVTLLDGNLVSYTPTTSISDTEIILTFGTPIAIADNSALEFLLGLYLNTTGIVDGSIIQLQIDAASSGFDAEVSGSNFIDPFTLGDVVGNDLTIDVDVTELVFTQQPPAIVEINAAMSNVILEAQDINGNVDTDYNLPIDITSTGTLSVSPVTELPVAGITTFATVTHTATGTGLVLTANDGLLPSVNSSAFDVVVLPTIIALQDFDGSLPDWSYTTSLPFFGSTAAFGSDFFGIIDITDASPLSYSNFSNNILGENDLENNNGGTFEFVTTSFAEIDISLYESVNISFDWEVIGYNGPTDDAGYEVFFDGISQGFQFLVDGDVDPQDGSGTISISVPNAISAVSLNVIIRNNGADGYSGFDNFELSGFLPSLVYDGNDSNGFGGPLGEGDLEITAFTGSTANFTFNRGSGVFGNNNDYMVIYVDSEAGGITTTSGLTDTGDSGRRAVSGFDGSNRSTINFPPGFEADFAIYLDENFAGVFELVEGGSHNFITTANLTPTGTTTASSYDFSVDFADLNTVAGAESFKFIATYLNSDNAFRSNEFIGDSDYNNNALGNPGLTTVDMNTYYQVSSRRKGGRASSALAGVWSNDAAWVNGNAPLEGDVITIDHDIVQDISYNSINNLGINSVEITGANTLTINSGITLEMADGITGSGNIAVNGKLSIIEGGFTDIVPVYTSGSTLEYKDITTTYNRFNEWNSGATVGSGVPDNVIIDNTDLDLSNPTGSITDEDFAIGSDLTVLNVGNLNIDPNKSLTIGGDLSNTDSSINLNSNAQNYPSIIVEGTSTGEVIYKRHVNTFNSTTNSTTGQNDLISAPVTNSFQTFFNFRTANTNLPSGNIGGVLSYLFGPFDNDNASSPYVNYSQSDDSEIILAGIGYRTASTDTSTFTFIGDVETSTVPVGVDIGAAYEWNLIGNPYPSYLNSGDFLTENAANLDEDAVGIYGYDGTADDDWTIINFNNMNEAENLAPGQGFMVAAEGASTLNFTPSMRRVAGSDDFIIGRPMDINSYLSIKLENNDSNYHTDFYFNSNSTRSLDPGYDAAIFNGALPEFYIYSHLVENNQGRNMAIQSLGENDLADITIPLGVNANQGETITFSIDASTLPSTVDVYLEDNVTNTFTLLTSGDYTLTPNTNLNGAGRFYLRVTNGALSTPENTLENLSIYTNQYDKTIVIDGQLFEPTTAKIYDLQGRVVNTSILLTSNRSQTIDVSNLSTGVYVVQLSNDTQNKSQKIILR